MISWFYARTLIAKEKTFHILLYQLQGRPRIWLPLFSIKCLIKHPSTASVLHKINHDTLFIDTRLHFLNRSQRIGFIQLKLTRVTINRSYLPMLYLVVCLVRSLGEFHFFHYWKNKSRLRLFPITLLVFSEQFTIHVKIIHAICQSCSSFLLPLCSCATWCNFVRILKEIIVVCLHPASASIFLRLLHDTFPHSCHS